MINDDHSQAWRKVTDAVHEVGGKIFFQAWHAGMLKPTICQKLPILLSSLTRSLPA
jgi:2,4-dienoyl-CoA reductase-like NADH-dependent reductase (Old Yellow Enzyme family)